MIKLVSNLPCPLSGASIGIVDCYELAEQVFGETGPDAGLLALPYMTRRFGPSPQPIDDYKEMAYYILTTERPDVFLAFSCKASGLSFLYLTTHETRKLVYKPRLDWEEACQEWYFSQHPEELAKVESKDVDARNQSSATYWGWRYNKEKMEQAEAAIGPFPFDGDVELIDEIKTALLAAMEDLLRPTYIRDVYFNLLGRCEPTEDSVEYFKIAE